MKLEFFNYIIEKMLENDDIYFISAGLGWPRTEELKEKFPDRFIQTEAAEQTALDIACGLAYAGKIPFIYTITPFLYRGFETIRTYINHEKLNVKLIGAGRNTDYSKHDGYSHDACDVQEILGTQKNIVQLYPETVIDMQMAVDAMIQFKEPYFLSLTR